MSTGIEPRVVNGIVVFGPDDGVNDPPSPRTFTAIENGPTWTNDRIVVVPDVATAEANASAAIPSDYIRIPNVGDFAINRTSTATRNGTTVLQVSGVTVGRWQLVAGSSLLATLPGGGTAAVSALTRASKTVAGSSVFSPVPGATTVPAAADVAAGLALLESSVLWGSSLGATRTIAGDETLTGTEMLALGWNECTDTAGIAADGGNSGVLVVPSTTATPGFPYHATTISQAGITAGMRVRLSGCWQPSHAVSGQTDSLTVYLGAGVTWRVCFRADGQIQSPAGVPYQNASVRHWKRADGWLEFCIEWIATDATVWLLCTVGNAGLAFTGDGASGLRLSNFSFCEVTAQTVENLSSGAATITQVAASAPWVETSRHPEDGWWTDGSDVFKFNELASKTLAFSAAGYQAINGTAQVVTLEWVWAPYQTPSASRRVWYFAGATAVLSLELTTANKLKVTRTTDAGVTTTLTFETIVGHTPAVYSVVLDGANALLYRQGVLAETDAFSLAGATTFTSGVFGGQVPARVAEFDMRAAADTATQVRQTHTALGVRRKLKLEPIPLWLFVGQSNMATNGTGILLATWGSPARNDGSLMYETYNPGGTWTSHYSGWGPARLNHHADWADSPTVQMYNNGADIGSQGLYASEVGFAEIYGRCATARYAAPGMGIDAFLTGGASRAAMLAAFDDAVATIGLPYYLAGVVMAHGETDAGSVALASAYRAKVLTLLSDLGARYGNADPALLMYRLHRGSDRTSEPFVALLAAEQEALASSRVNTATAAVDDERMNFDHVHLTEGTTQLTLGRRLGAAALSVGA